MAVGGWDFVNRCDRFGENGGSEGRGEGGSGGMCMRGMLGVGIYVRGVCASRWQQ